MKLEMKVAAGEAPESGVQLLQLRDNFRAEAVEVVGGHERDGADVEVARALAGDLKRAGVGVGSRR